MTRGEFYFMIGFLRGVAVLTLAILTSRQASKRQRVGPRH